LRSSSTGNSSPRTNRTVSGNWRRNGAAEIRTDRRSLVAHALSACSVHNRVNALRPARKIGAREPTAQNQLAIACFGRAPAPTDVVHRTGNFAASGPRVSAGDGVEKPPRPWRLAATSRALRNKKRSHECERCTHVPRGRPVRHNGPASHMVRAHPSLTCHYPVASTAPTVVPSRVSRFRGPMPAEPYLR
jgi:hypothetical protein